MNYDNEYRKKVSEAQKKIDDLYNEMYRLVALWAISSNIDIDKRFWFTQYPKLSDKVETVIASVSYDVESVIKENIKNVWELSNTKNDTLVDKAYQRINKTPPPILKQPDLEVLDKALNRKVGGLNISQRVWKYNPSVKAQMQAAIDIAIKEGKSAESLAKDLKKYLNEPDKLFRKVRDEYGGLKWSKKAMMYNPGQGVYRSAHKNALRLAANEINVAYRENDYLRWQKLDFIVGYRIQVSPRSSTVCPICLELAGVYPKDFKFTHWHISCRCTCIPIFSTDDKNTQPPLPDNFKRWFEENKSKVNPGNPPSWYNDNKSVLAKNDSYISKAKAQATQFDKLSKELAKRTGINVTDVNIKSDSRILDKAILDYNGDISKVKDVIRNTFVVQDGKQGALINEISKTFDFQGIKKQLATTDPLGYSGTIINVKINGVMAEIQINTPQMLYGKDLSAKTIIGNNLFNKLQNSGVEAGLGHKYYEEWRKLKSNVSTHRKRMDELERLSKEYYSKLRNLKID